VNLQPTSLNMISDDLLQIVWSDDQVRRYAVRELRDQCPCASCRENRNAPQPPAVLLPVLSEAETQPLRIMRMEPAGRYAYAIHFSDGHDTGLFTLESLRELGNAVEE